MFVFWLVVFVVCYLINDLINELDKRWNNNILDKNWIEMFVVWEFFIIIILILYLVVFCGIEILC